MSCPVPTCVPSPWYIVVWQLVTHINFLILIAYTWKQRRKIANSGFSGIMLAFTTFASLAYHTCDTTCNCLFNKPVYLHQIYDNILATNVMTVLFVVISATAALYEAYRNDSIYWGQVVTFTPLGIIILMVVMTITGPNQGMAPEQSLPILLLIIFMTFLKILYIDRGRILILEKFSSPAFYIGLASVVIALACYLIEPQGYEWFTHGLWHYLASLGSCLIYYSQTNWLPDLPDNVLREGQIKDQTMLNDEERSQYRDVEMDYLVTSTGYFDHFYDDWLTDHASVI